MTSGGRRLGVLTFRDLSIRLPVEYVFQASSLRHERTSVAGTATLGHGQKRESTVVQAASTLWSLWFLSPTKLIVYTEHHTSFKTNTATTACSVSRPWVRRLRLREPSQRTRACYNFMVAPIIA